MNERWKLAWVHALRSGDYVPSEYGLHTEAGAFSALGVLIDIAVDGWWIWDPGEHRYEYEDHTIAVPDSVLADVGLDRANERRIAVMQHDRRTFDQIADWIENNV